MNRCAVCDQHEPADWCWASRPDCPFGKPPRYLNLEDLWRWCAELQRRVDALEALLAE
jgi:hypothetical protein